MNKIVLITTKYCEGCNIMHKSIKQALNCTSKKIEYVVKDITDLTKEEKSKVKLCDFPTTLFYKDARLHYFIKMLDLLEKKLVLDLIL